MSAVLIAAGPIACASVPAGVPSRYPVQQGDSLARAYETGRRDAMYGYQNFLPVVIRALSFPLTLTLARQGKDYRTFMFVPPAIATGIALRSYSRVTARMPEPSDSMRAKYGFASDRLWAEYRLGFQDAHYDRRRQEFVRDTQAAILSGLSALVFWSYIRDR